MSDIEHKKVQLLETVLGWLAESAESKPVEKIVDLILEKHVKIYELEQALGSSHASASKSRTVNTLM